MDSELMAELTSLEERKRLLGFLDHDTSKHAGTSVTVSRLFIVSLNAHLFTINSSLAFIYTCIYPSQDFWPVMMCSQLFWIVVNICFETIKFN